MTKRKIARSPKTTKRAGRRPLAGAVPKVKRAASVLPTPKTEAPPVPAATVPEPTFTLKEIHEAFGHNYSGFDAVVDPMDVARDALDDAVRTLRLVEENLVGDSDWDVLRDVVCNAGIRGNAAVEVLGRFVVRRAAKGGAS